MSTQVIAPPRPLVAPFAAGPLVRMALGEVTRGLGGFRILIACIALGVAVIAGVGGLSDALKGGFERQGKSLLGGDVALSRPHRRATDEERRWLAGKGRLSEAATMRSMARRADGSEQALVEVKGVDSAYPLVGTVKLAGVAAPRSISGAGGVSHPATPDWSRALAFDGNGPAKGAGPGAVVDPLLLQRLGLAVGDRMQLGRITVVVSAVLAPGGEPDKIADRFTVGPRVFVSLETLAASGLAEPGGLVQWRYLLDLAPGAETTDLLAFRNGLKSALPEAGFAIADRTNPSPSLRRTLDQLRQFLTLIGLASLMIGGVGVANAVAAYVDRRRKVIATMKSLGASGRQIFVLHLMQVLALAGIGIGIGLTIGLLLPLAVGPAIAGLLPVEIRISPGIGTLALATSYGMLVTLLFSLWPLGRAGRIRAAALFRDDVEPARQRPPWPIVGATVAVAAAMAALAIATSQSRGVALYFCGGIALIFIIFPALGVGLAWLARRVPRPRNPELALALAGIGAPGGLTRSVVLSLGAGLSLLTGVALVNTALLRELQTRLPANSPDYFLVDVPKAEMASLDALISRLQPASQIVEAPMLRGRITALKGVPVEQIKAPPEAQWVLRGDRGLTYAETPPSGSKLAAGTWWSADYSGEPLVSFDAEMARHLKLGVGDTVTVNILGRNVTARIASLRDVQWENLGINFVMVFSPNVLQGAPHTLLATVALPKGATLAEEADFARQIGKAHASVAIIRVKDAIAAFTAVFGKIMIAIRIAGGVTLAAGALVLAGALTTAQRRRIKLAVILKALGATRRQILRMHLAEYLLLALATAGLAVAIGTLGAWAAVVLLMKLPFAFSASAVAQSLGLAIALVVVFGLAGTRAVLEAPPVPYLRSD